jgi:hypothetical protein
MVTMRVLPLRTYDLPDVGDHLIHFTGRRGPKLSVESGIEELPPQERLVHILVEGVIRAFETFGSAAPVVCLSESTKAAVTKLIREGRYEPCGIGFSRSRPVAWCRTRSDGIARGVDRDEAL